MKMKFRILCVWITWIQIRSGSNYVNYEYLGCYKDNGDRMLDVKITDGSMTVELCYNKCSKYSHFGLQIKKQCFCGYSTEDATIYPRRPENECNKACAGNTSQTCGGFWRMNVYRKVDITSAANTVTTTLPDLTSRYTDSTVTTLPDLKSPNTDSTVTTLPDSTSPNTDSTVITLTDLTSSNTDSTVTTLPDLTRSNTHSTVITLPDLTSSNTDSAITTLLDSTSPNTDITVTTLSDSTSPKTDSTTTTLPDSTNQHADSTINSCKCTCSNVGQNKWWFLQNFNLTMQEIKVIMQPELEALEKELRVKKTNTNRLLRSKTSATDDRISSTTIGYAGAISVCVVLFVPVLQDILRCGYWIYFKTKVKCLKKS
ncbi:uncharacterized protein LOC143078263 isoform X2 [Mytilus galloprovincialis]|uniref:uncharacterized protein LOC143078263 isoform X2 n=1 Tax=Mytilus galloprovincialis TaxID=29158 RepID=UPI003F7C1963